MPFESYLFTEVCDVVGGFIPVDMQTGANNGVYVSLAEFEGLTVVLFKSVGTSGDDPTITLQQAQDISGTGVKALNVTGFHKKVGATSVLTVKQATFVSQAAANTVALTGAAADSAIVMINIRRELLDISNGFCTVRATIADTGTNAQLGCLYYIMWGANFMRSIEVTALETEATDST
jgi:hypothetical protein